MWGPELVGLRRLVLGQAGKRRVVLVQVRGRAERLVVDLRLAVAGGRRLGRDVRVLGRDRRLALHHASPTRSRAGAPHCWSTSGTSSPWFSSSAIMCRQVTAVPLSVCTCRGPGRWRMSSRRAWKSVVFEVEVTSP